MLLLCVIKLQIRLRCRTRPLVNHKLCFLTDKLYFGDYALRILRCKLCFLISKLRFGASAHLFGAGRLCLGVVGGTCLVFAKYAWVQYLHPLGI